MTPADWGKFFAPIAIAVLASFGVEAVVDQQSDDALYNCERDNDLRQDIRETLLNFVPKRDVDAALKRFEEVICAEHVGQGNL